MTSSASSAPNRRTLAGQPVHSDLTIEVVLAALSIARNNFRRHAARGRTRIRATFSLAANTVKMHLQLAGEIIEPNEYTDDQDTRKQTILKRGCSTPVKQ